MVIEMEGIKGDRWFWLTLLVGGFFLSLTLWYDYGMDQAICIYEAWAWKEFHLAPYAGTWDLSFPGIFILHRVALELFGPGILGFRIFDLLVQLSSVGMIFYLTEKTALSQTRVSALPLSALPVSAAQASARHSGFIAGVFFSIYYYGLGSWGTGEREGFVLWLFLAGLCASLVLENRPWARASVTGLLLGLVFLIKPTFGLSWVVFGIWFLAQGLRKKDRRVWAGLMLFGFCCLLPSLLVILYYWRLGSLKEVYLATVWFNFNVYSKATRVPVSGIRNWALVLAADLFIFGQALPVALLTGMFGILLKLRDRPKDQDRGLIWALVGLLGTGLISYQFQGKYFDYHQIPIWGLLMIFSGSGLGWMGSQLSSGRSRLVSGVFYSAVAVLLISILSQDRVIFAARYGFRSFERAYESELNPSSQERMVAKRLRPLLRPGDGVEYFAKDPLVPLLLERKLPTRFLSVIHLLLQPYGGSITDQQKQWIAEYTRAVISARPRFFAIETPATNPELFNFSSDSFKQAMAEQFPELAKFLGNNYRLQMRIGRIEVYEILEQR